MVIDGSNGLKFPDNTNQQTAIGYNRLINGSMQIDQRNAGASVTQDNTIKYSVDRWAIYGNTNSKFTAQQNAGSVTPPTGFVNYLGITSSSAYTVGSSEQYITYQAIEGFNIADLGWGTANASTVTMSFWVRSSLTGTFGGALRNSADNRSYPFTYTISAANTWEQKTITIAGDTTGTWLTTNGAGIKVIFGLGVGSTLSGTAGAWSGSTFSSVTGATSVVGTNGATFYITGVQLEKGSTATSFDYRPYGTELQLCYRYYRKFNNSGSAYTSIGSGVTFGSTQIARWGFTLDTPMRAAPTISFTNCVGWNGVIGTAVSVNTAYSTVNNLDADLTTSGITNTSGLAAKVLMTSTGYIELTGAEL
jgi:hypothetical protein